MLNTLVTVRGSRFVSFKRQFKCFERHLKKKKKIVESIKYVQCDDKK